MSRWGGFLLVFLFLLFSIWFSFPAVAQTSPADKQQIQKILTQLKQALSQAEAVFKRNQFDDAIKGYQALFDQVQPYKTDPLFSAEKDKVEIRTLEYRALVG